MAVKLFACEGCEVEFKIVFPGEGDVNYCPNCGDEIYKYEDDEVWDEIDDEEEDWD